MNTRKIGLVAASVLAAGVLAGGAVMAQASDSTTASSAGTSSSQVDSTAPQGIHEHTEVTGEELATVTEAVQAHDSAATVESVAKDPDGSYDVRATKDGEPVMLEVSADLATITERAGGPGQGSQGKAGQPPDGAPGQGGLPPDGGAGQPPAADGASSTSTDDTAPTTETGTTQTGTTGTATT
jgi:hypothetical protein